MQPYPSTALWTESLKFKAKINIPVLKGKPKMSKNQEQFTKSDFDFMKDVFSAFLTQAETTSQNLKDEAKLLKSTNPDFSLMCYAGIKKIKLKIKKLAEIQRKVKRLR